MIGEWAAAVTDYTSRERLCYCYGHRAGRAVRRAKVKGARYGQPHAGARRGERVDSSDGDLDLPWKEGSGRQT